MAQEPANAFGAVIQARVNAHASSGGGYANASSVS